MRKKVAVLGLGMFGYKFAVDAAKNGKTEIFAVDNDPKIVEKIKEHVSHAAIGDLADEEVIQELGVKQFDLIVVGMGSHLETQILAITFLKKNGAKVVLAKANSAIQKEILLKIGADHVTLPEEDFAIQLAQKVSHSNINETVAFGNTFIGEVTVPKRFIGFTVRELDFYRRYKMMVILYKKKDEPEAQLLLNPNTVLNEGDELTVISESNNIAEVLGE